MKEFDIIYKSINSWGKYQKYLSLVIVVTSLTIPTLVVILPMMQRPPDFYYLENNTKIQINREHFCKTTFLASNFEVMKNKIVISDSSVKNWASELKIVCNTKLIVSIIGTAFFMGNIASNLGMAKLPDRYGRKNIFLVFNFFSMIGSIQMYFLYHIGQIIIASFIAGLSGINMAIGAVLINENIDRKYSGLVMGITNAAFPFLGLLNVVIMYYIADWKIYQLCLIVFSVTSNLLAVFYLKESAKWLYANKYYNRFHDSISFIAELNGTTEELKKSLEKVNSSHLKLQSPKQNSQLKTEVSHENYRKYNYQITDLVRFTSIRMLSLKNMYMWVISGFCFYGLLLNLEGFTGDIFIDSLVTYSAEFIAEVVSGDISHTYGRKRVIIISYILAAFGCILFEILKLNYFGAALVFLFIASLGIASGFNVLYLYTSELYPTNIKSLAVSIFSLANRISSSFVPTFLTFFSGYIVLTMGLMSFVAVIVTCTMPESDLDPGDEVKEAKIDTYELFILNDKNESKKKGAIYMNDIFLMSP